MRTTLIIGSAALAATAFSGCSSQQASTGNDSMSATTVTATAAARPHRPAPDTLTIGDTAPSYSIEHWVKGGAISDFEPGNIYVMEFWATWCPPCRTSMPHLSGLQEEYGDNVTIIGVSDEDLDTVTTFLTKKDKSDGKVNDDRTRYTLTTDPDRSTYNAFMKPAGQRGIPTAFIIDGDGRVAWIGHPMSLDEPLSEIVAGTWDIAAARSERENSQKSERAMSALETAWGAAEESGNWQPFVDAVDKHIATYGDNGMLGNIEFEAMLKAGDKTGAYAWAETLAKKSWDDAQALNAIAWPILDETPTEWQDLDFALKVAKRANTLTGANDPAILDTLARAYWELGDSSKAIAWQEKAVEYASDDGPMADSIRATLDQYRSTMATAESSGTE